MHRPWIPCLLLWSACGAGDVHVGGHDAGDDDASLQDGGLHEPCNGQDDDGDGLTDTDPQGNPLTRKCETACGTGGEYCEDGEWVCYAPSPHEDVCDNIDNDCDGEIDEGCACRVGDTEECGPENMGACRRGVRICQTDGNWGECSGATLGGEEECGNGIDDDCNGQTDESCGCAPSEEQDCGLDRGECVPGTQLCSEDGEWGQCEDSIGPEGELCNGLDDNCDGAVDEFWVDDEYEANDTCERRYHAGDVEQGAQPVILNDLSLYGTGDNDWFYLRCEEVGFEWCFPGADECVYRFSVQVTLESDMSPEDVEVCIVDGTCAEQADANRTFCSHGQDWFEEYGSYLMALEWGGVCGRDDSKDFQVVVRAAEAACGYYGIAWRFEKADDDCP